MKTYESVVIGGGPAGATAALYLLRSGTRTAFIEKLSTGGQMLMTEEIENYPGFPDGIKGYELADLMEKHLASYECDRIRDEVSLIEPGEKVHKIHVGGEIIGAKTIILCTGARYRQLDIPGEAKFLGRGVSYCALCDGNFFRNQNIAVVGGGNSALEESLYLAKLVNKISLVHRRDEFRGLKLYQDKCAANSKIEFNLSNIPLEILGDDSGVTGLKLKNVKTGDDSILDVTGVFIFVGFEPVDDILPKDLELDHGGFIKTDQDMATNIPGIYAAGDIRSKSCRQVATAVGDGATAATSAFTYLEQHHG